MIVRNVTAIALAVAAIISLVSVWFYPSIQDFMQTNPFWNGLRDFSAEFDVTLTESPSDISKKPESTALIIIPYSPYHEDYLEDIEDFVQHGGFLLLFDDYGYGNTILEHLGLETRFSGRSLLDPLFCYKNQWLPRVTHFSTELADADIEAVVLNHGTALSGVDSTKALAWSSDSSFLDLNENDSLDEGEPGGPFPIAAVTRLGNGTVLILSDPSISINSMVGRDNNHDFLEHLIQEYGQGRELLADISRLPKTPLDESKLRLSQTKERIEHPYSVMAVLGTVVFLIFRPWQRKGAN